MKIYNAFPTLVHLIILILAEKSLALSIRFWCQGFLRSSFRKHIPEEAPGAMVKWST